MDPQYSSNPESAEGPDKLRSAIFYSAFYIGLGVFAGLEFYSSYQVRVYSQQKSEARDLITSQCQQLQSLPEEERFGMPEWSQTIKNNARDQRHANQLCQTYAHKAAEEQVKQQWNGKEPRSFIQDLIEG